jgi:hypothetical protein
LFIDQFKSVFIMKKVKISIVFLLLSFIINAQVPPDTVWTELYGGNDLEEAYALEPTMDGGFIIAANTRSFGAGVWDAWLIKTDAQGNQEWAKTYGGTGIDHAYDVKQTEDGGYIAAGRTDQDGSSFSKVWLVRTDGTGNLLWTQAFGENDKAELANSLEITNDGDFIIAGVKEVEPYDEPHEQFWLIKMDADGNMIWNQTYGGPDYDGAFSVRQTSDSGFIIIGTTEMQGSMEDIRLIKTNLNGALEWEKTYGGFLNDAGLDVIQTQDDGYLLTGKFQNTLSVPSEMWVIKTDADGNQMWDNVFGGLSGSMGYALTDDPESGYLLAGMTSLPGTGDSEGWLVKINGDGDEVWTKTIGTSDMDRFRDITITAQGDIILTGDAGTFGNTDAWLVKVGSVLGISENKTNGYKLNISPNPVLNRFNVNFSLPEQTSVSLKLYNLRGKIIRSLYKGVEQGEKLISLPAGNLSEGVYIVCLEADGIIVTSKRIVVISAL